MSNRAVLVNIVYVLSFSLFIVDDGSCIVDILMKNGVTLDRTSGKELKLAAKELLEKCVGDRRTPGGVLSQIGTYLFITARRALDRLAFVRRIPSRASNRC